MSSAWSPMAYIRVFTCLSPFSPDRADEILNRSNLRFHFDHSSGFSEVKRRRLC